MKQPRNSAKAIIIENGCLLLEQCQVKLRENSFIYLFPGGGQEFGETLTNALQRECREELGAEIEIGELAVVREYIDPHSRWGDQHQVEFYFFCKLKSAVDLSKATQPDDDQAGVVWIPLNELGKYIIYPQALRDNLSKSGKISLPIYIGAVQ